MYYIIVNKLLEYRMEGKKLLVLSDTHGNIPALREVLNWALTRLPPNDTINAAVFLGDGISNLRPAADATGFFCEWKLVKGNNDHGFSIPEAAVFDFCGHRFFICHGHRYALYNGYHTLIAAARNREADAALFGHTHTPYCKNTDGILLVNPGSIGRPRSESGATFALIECALGKPLEVHFWGIASNGEIREV